MRSQYKKIFLVLIISLSNFLIIHPQSIPKEVNENLSFQSEDVIKTETENRTNLNDSISSFQPEINNIKKSEKKDYYRLRSSTGLISFFNEVLFYWFQHP
ncbi:hypothetical protein [Marivirga sp.]|uniref:hypothetical protein n=1 Tax=Marivirga sp. TaxID=2018662 RepID=UPI003DA765B5